MGMLTNPKLMLPFQIARIRNYFEAESVNAWMSAEADADIVTLDDRLPQYRNNLPYRGRVRDREGATNSTRSALRSPKRKFTPRSRASCADSHCEADAQGNYGTEAYDHRHRSAPRVRVIARPFYAAVSNRALEMPRSSNNLINVSSIKLLGQDAPAVMPTTTGPGGNQKRETTSRFSCES